MQQDVYQLILNYLRGEINAGDRESLDLWRQDAPEHEALFQKLTDKEWIGQQMESMYQDFPVEVGWETLQSKRNMPVAKTRTLNWKPWVGVAAVTAMAVISLLWMQLGKKQVPVSQLTQSERFKNDIPPANEGAVLTLGNGQKVPLEEIHKGKAIPGQEQAALQSNGILSYEDKQGGKTLSYNTLTTPKGNSFQIQLSDGTRVWLNAGSSITYPVSFRGGERKVSLSGEAYFEVAPELNPFIVNTKDMEILVLGTHFNVKAYDNENTWRTTLLEGAVKVQVGREIQLLSPGKQASWERSAEKIETDKVDTEEVMAWKNGLFWFNNANINEVMHQLERWYDIEVIYEDEVDIHFSGTIPKNVNITTVLKTLELTNGVKFKIEGNKITILKP